MHILFEMVQVTMVVESKVWSSSRAWIQDTSSHLPPICLDKEYVGFQASYETSITDNEQAYHNPIAEVKATRSTPYNWTKGKDEQRHRCTSMYMCVLVFVRVCAWMHFMGY